MSHRPAPLADFLGYCGYVLAVNRSRIDRHLLTDIKLGYREMRMQTNRPDGGLKLDIPARASPLAHGRKELETDLVAAHTTPATEAAAPAVR